MNRERLVADPPRLVDSDDPAGRLLRQADQAFRQGLAPGPAWKKFRARGQQRRFLSFTAAAVTVLGVAGWMVARPHFTFAPPPTETLTAERFPTREPGPPVSQVPPVDRRNSPVERSPMRAAPAHSLRRSAAPATPTLALAPDASLTDNTCRTWSSQGHFQQAVDCYQTIARPGGLGAEVALYEAARISAESQLDPRRALALLDQHRERFPNSVLRVEVEWLRVRSLERAGRVSEALASSEVLLGSAAGRTLAPQLHLLRGRIYSDAQKDCSQAVREYVALLGEPGAAGDEAELRRAQCFETLGRTSDARAAYEHYLSRSSVAHPALARDRLQALSLPSAELPSKGTP